MKTILCIAVYAGLFLQPIHSQTITFKKNLGFFNDDYGRYVLTTNDKGYIIVGYSENKPGNVDFDILVARLDSAGNTQWIRTYDHFVNDHAYCIEQAADGGFIIVGDNYAWISLLKISAQGDVLWSKTYHDTSAFSVNLHAAEVVQPNDTTIFAIGMRTIGNVNFWDTYASIYLIRTNEFGDTAWTKSYGGMKYKDGFDGGGFISATPDGHIVIGSYKFLFKIDIEGTILWSHNYGGTNIATLQDGGYALLGSQTGDTLKRLDNGGNLVWSRVYSSYASGYYRAVSVREARDGGFVISGTSPDNDIFLTKTDSNGNTLWLREFPGVGETPRQDVGYAVQPTGENGYVLAGQRYIGAVSGYDMYVIRTDSLGEVHEKYLDLGERLSSGDRLKATPNPVRGKGYIAFTPAVSGSASIVLQNLLGQRVLNIFTAAVIAGERYLMEYNGGSLPNGPYILSVEAPAGRSVHQVIVSH